MPQLKKSQREKDITRVSTVGIIANGLLGIIKIIAGIAASSVAIITDAINNLTDTSSSIITIIGTHLATRHPDRKHPFGYGRVEYLTSLVIGLIVFFTGVETCRSSIHSIIHPEDVHFTWISAAILAATVLVKIILGAYTLRSGRKLNSGALVASGMDARSDAVATTAALGATVLYLWKGVSVDAWVGAVISLYIVWTGFTILRDTVSKIVGEAVPKELADEIRARAQQVPIVNGAYDLILNNYGPDFYVGSINVEVDHRLTAEEICRELHPVQKQIYQDLRAIIVFGLYAVDKEKAETAPAAKALADYCQSHPGCLNYHGLFVDTKNKKVYCDVTVDFKTDESKIESGISQALENALPGFTPMITIDTSFASAE